jgi:multidrug efflux system membrane fusion protein
VLAHELAHLKRRDHWVRRLEAVACGLYWWDPIAWWARREIERAEEQCCDAWVLWALPTAAGAYAEALVATAVYLSGRRQPLPVGASGVGHLIPLKRRLEMIVCDSLTGSFARTAPRALLVLGILSLPFLPAPASGEPPGDVAQTGIEVVHQDRSAEAARPPKTNHEPSALPALDNPQERGAPPAPPAAPKVLVRQPIIRDIGGFIDLEQGGRLNRQRIGLRAPVSGKLDRLNCRIGQRIKKGEVLFEIDPRSYQAELNKADAEVRRARARVKRWAAELERAQGELRKHIAPQRSVDQPKGEREEAEAALEVAQADRDLAKLKLESTKVTAPIDGVISRVLAQLGEIVTANIIEIVELISLDPLFVDFYVDEDTALLLNRLKTEGKVKPNAEPELPILIGVRDEEGFSHGGLLVFVDPEIQPVPENAVHCRAVIPNSDGSLSPGLKARVRLVTTPRHKAILVPREAVRIDQEARGHVFVVNGQGILEKRLVRGGPVHAGLREVEEGLKPEEWVVIHRLDSSWAGQKVNAERLKPPARPSSNPGNPQAPRR